MERVRGAVRVCIFPKYVVRLPTIFPKFAPKTVVFAPLQLRVCPHDISTFDYTI